MTKKKESNILDADKQMSVVMMDISEIEPYENNPRLNEGSVDYVANSLLRFGWKQPIVVDRDKVIIAGHTRYKAAKKLGMMKVPVLIADDLTDEEVKAYRLADNKAGESSLWDFDKLDVELSGIGIDMGDFGFRTQDFEWNDEEGISEENYGGPVEQVSLVCPACGHVDLKINFKKADEE